MKRITIIAALLVSLLLAPAYAERSMEQTLTPEITLYFSNAETGSGNANPDRITRISARAVYEGCVQGETYNLVLQLEDSVSGKYCLFYGRGENLRQTFTAEGKAGYFMFEFEIDATGFSGGSLRERHYIETEMSDISGEINEASGKIYVPKIKAEAVNEAGEKTVYASKKCVICDVINYYGLAPGETYRLVTGLVDSATGEKISGADGQPLTAVSRFTPEKETGRIAARISADLREHGDTDIIVYEELYIVPKNASPMRLLSNETDSEEDRTVFAQLTEINVLDRYYCTPIAEAKLQIRSVAGDEDYVVSSDAEGRCLLPLDKDTAYTYTITSAPKEYLIQNGSDILTLCENGETPGNNIFLLKKNMIVLHRTDADTGEPIKGLVSEVRNSQGELLAAVFSDENGQQYMDADDYCKEELLTARLSGKTDFVLSLDFEDVSTPSEYYPREKTWSVSIDENGNIMGLLEVKSVKRNPIAIRVISVGDKGIPGVEFSVIGPDGLLQGRAVTDHDGKIYFTAKRIGTYTLIENAVPLGYTLSLKERKFTIEENGEVTGTVTIIKLSEDFTGNVMTVVVLTAIFIAGWLSAQYYFNRTIHKRLGTGLYLPGKRGKH